LLKTNGFFMPNASNCEGRAIAGNPQYSQSAESSVGRRIVPEDRYGTEPAGRIACSAGASFHCEYADPNRGTVCNRTRRPDR
jgi:hypothetical protein